MRGWGGPAVRRSALLLLAACSPATTRPDFRAFPEARTQLLDVRREQVIVPLADAVKGAGLRVRRANALDGYLETDWYDVQSHRSFRDDRYVPDLAHAVKIRCWADPYVPSETVLTIEAVYRPRYDPSRAERDLEEVLPQGHAGRALVDALLKAARDKFGVPKAAGEEP